MTGTDGYNSKRAYSVFVKAVTNGVSLSPREILESAYYRGVYEAKGGDLSQLVELEQSDPTRFNREQIELFAPRVIWKGRRKRVLETSTDNVVELKM
jgi:hypothetical protein